MSSRSLNKVQLIGNLTRDPELRYTPQGTAVCTFGLATNRSWVTESGEKREETEFHRIVVWNKLAELCAQLIFKGRKVYVEGRLQTRSWTGQDGSQRQTTEVVIEEMIILDNRQAGENAPVRMEAPKAVEPSIVAEPAVVEEAPATEENLVVETPTESVVVPAPTPEEEEKTTKKKKAEKATTEEVKEDSNEDLAKDIPF